MEIDEDLLNRVLAKICELARQGLTSNILRIQKDPEVDNGIIFETLVGPAKGLLFQEGDKLVIQFKTIKKQITIPIEDVIGKPN